jgi:hypothetical protein
MEPLLILMTAEKQSSDSFVYSVFDGEFTIDNLTGTITVSPVNDIPTATDLSINIDEASSTVVDFCW